MCILQQLHRSVKKFSLNVQTYSEAVKKKKTVIMNLKHLRKYCSVNNQQKL